MALAALGLGVVTAPASADTRPPAGVPDTVSARQLPTWQIDGVAWQQAMVGNTVFVTGNFSTARPPGVPVGGPGTIQAKNFFAYDITTGNPISKYSRFFNAPGYTVVPSPDGTRVYVGGDFAHVDGKPRAHIAAIDVATGALLNDFQPSFDGRVRAIAVHGNTVYVGGTFNRANGVARTTLAAVSRTGQLLSWAPTTAEGTLLSMVATPDGSKVVIGGQFARINGAMVYGHGAVNATTGASVPWAANSIIRNYNRGGTTSLRTDGTYIYGTSMAYGSGGRYEGPFAVKQDGTLHWLADCQGDTYDTAITGGVVYSVGHAHNCSMVGSFPDTAPRVRWMRAMAMTVDVKGVNNGPDMYGWNYKDRPAPGVLHFWPDLGRGTFTGQGQGPWTASTNGAYLALGGEFPTVNGSAQQGLVRFAKTSASPATRTIKWQTTPNRTLLPTRAKALSNGTIKVFQQSGWDEDNESLTYEVYRNHGQPGQKLIATVSSPSSFYNLPDLTFTDTNVPAGSHTYRVRVTDGTGNAEWATRSAPVQANLTSPAAVNHVRSAGATSLWRLNEPAGDTSLYDLLGSRDGKVGPGVTRGAAGAFAGDSDTASSFSGSSTGWATAGSQATPAPGTYSVAAWFKTTSTAGGRIVGFSSAVSGSSTSADRMIYVDNARRLRFGAVSNGAPLTIGSQATVNDGRWHHVVATYGANGMTLYLDGQQVARTAAAGPVTYNGYWRIGGDTIASNWTARPNSGYLNGQIDDVALFPSELSPNAVRAQYLAGTGQLANLPPTGQVTANTTGLRVDFTVDAQDADGTVTGVTWDFGDGTTGTGTSVSHTYREPGTYQVTATLTDNDGDTTVVGTDVTVEAPSPIIAQDAFNRTVPDGWGVATAGGTWTVTRANTTSYSVAAGQATLAAGAGATAVARLTTATSDTDLRLSFTPVKQAAGGSQFFSVYAKGSNANGYSARIVTATNQRRTLSLTRIVGGAETVLSSVALPGTQVAGTSYDLRVQATGGAATALRVKVWASNEAEPQAWQLTATDATASLANAGGLGIRVYASGTTTNGPIGYQIRSLIARTPDAPAA